SHHRTRRLGTQILLPEVHAVRAGEPCYVRAIVDDDACTGRVGALDNQRRRVEQPAARGVLRAHLQERRAAGETRRREIDERPPRGGGDLGVNDGVERREDHTASASRPARGRARKGSMNDGLSLPGMNSGSARMRRGMGMLVLMPSMTVISSVRFMRAIASCRSRPWTMILAIIES